MKNYDYIIVGAGAAGLMMAYRMAKDAFFDNKSILIIDKEKKNSNDRTWCYWEKGKGEWDDLLHTSWDSIIFESETYHLKKKITPYTYKLIRSSNFYQKIWAILDGKNNIDFIKCTVKTILQEKEFATVTTTQNSKYTTKKLLNSILFDNSYLKQTKYPVLKQHFVGWFVELQEDTFDDSTATFMDFNIPQKGNTRFMYVLPISKKIALFEYTLFSKDLLHYDIYEKAIKNYLEEKNITKYTILEKEDGIIPMTSYKFWKKNSENIIHMGTSGGWSKASTGFTFMNTIKKTKQLTSYLKKDKSLSNFHSKSKYWFYDLLLLDILAEKNELGTSLFSRLFQRNSTTKIFEFLDGETTFIDDLQIMSKMPSYLFGKALFKRILNKSS
ncbi:lycopene cyclase family protein [Polaribacter sp. R77954]|uniref:lycopene cyclase family protein n=1 Tax=Polaribacter sp. R77954 TaxID=3093870 RepID=UPI0037C9B0C2